LISCCLFLHTHLNVDAIELVEAAPGTALTQTGEELAHHAVIDLVRAVEDNAANTDRLCQVLGRLRPSDDQMAERIIEGVSVFHFSRIEYLQMLLRSPKNKSNAD
jgi:hypothetical protein